MTQDRAQRRLAAIVAADVAGYSRLMERDEEGTAEELRGIRDELADPLLAEHRGRVANTAGDSLLLEFASAVDAVRWAIAFQHGNALRQADRPEDSRLHFRIGINLGDVVSHGRDLLGNGVNIAARIEAAAEPGGINISRAVRDQVTGKLALAFESLGDVRVKNIHRPVEMFCIRADARGAAPPRRLRRRLVLAALFACAAILGVYGAAQLWQNRFEPASVAAMALPLPDKPSVVVVPFANLSNDPDQSALADGITEDLITDLSKLSGLFVIGRSTSFALKDRDLPAKEIAETLGVRYILSGSVRRVDQTLRINAQLADATSGTLIWAERLDSSVEDVFAAQDSVAIEVVTALELELSATERRDIRQNETAQVAAREAFQRGWDLFSRFNRDDNARSVSHFERAVDLDPDYGRAYGALALVHQRAASFFDWDVPMNVPDASLYYVVVPEYLREADRLGSALVHVVRAMRFLNYRDQAAAEGSNRGTDDARRSARAAIAARPSDPEAHLMMAWSLVAAGENEEGLGFARQAKRLDPSFPSHYDLVEAAAHYGLGDPDAARQVLEAGLTRDPLAHELRPMLASVLAQQGHRRRAQDQLERWLAALSDAGRETAVSRYFFPIRWVERRLNMQLRDGLKLAALPPEDTVAALAARLSADPEHRVETIRALGWYGHQAASAVAALMPFLDDTHALVRRETVITLGKIGPAATKAAPRLETMIDIPLIGYHARAALAAIRSE